jgi:hypothetical protein
MNMEIDIEKEEMGKEKDRKKGSRREAAGESVKECAVGL